MSNWSKILLYTIVPTIVTGLFAIAPKLYDIAFEAKPRLSYSMLNSPELQTAEGFQRITSVYVENTGKRPLSNVAATLTIRQGRILSHDMEDHSGLNPTLAVNDSQLTVHVPRVFPSEKLAITLLITSSLPKLEPEFVLRSDDVPGTAQDVVEARGDAPIRLSALLAMTSVLVMSLLLLFRTGGRSILSSDKHDAIFYISARTGLSGLLKSTVPLGSQPTYARYADMLLDHGLSAENEQRTKAEKALMCLVLVKDMAKYSKTIVIRNLRVLQGDAYDQATVDSLIAKSIETGNTMKFREGIDQLLSQQM